MVGSEYQDPYLRGVVLVEEEGCYGCGGLMFRLGSGFKKSELREEYLEVNLRRD
jgi:hypothetical protein